MCFDGHILIRNTECLLLLGHILFADGTFPYCPCDSGQPFFVVSVTEERSQGSESSTQPNQVAGFLIFCTLHRSQIRRCQWSRHIKLSVTAKEAAILVAMKLLFREYHFLKEPSSKISFLSILAAIWQCRSSFTWFWQCLEVSTYLAILPSQFWGSLGFCQDRRRGW